MLSKESGVKFTAILFTFITLAAIAVRCANNSTSIYGTLREYLDTITVVNAHEHQRWLAEYEGHAYNFYNIMAHSYLQAALVSAGAPRLKTETINQGKLEDLRALSRFLSRQELLQPFRRRIQVPLRI